MASVLGLGPDAIECAAGLAISIDDSADMLALEGGADPFWGPPIDDLKLLQESGMVKQIEQDPFERQGLKVTLPQFSDGDVAYERGRWVRSWGPGHRAHPHP